MGIHRLEASLSLSVGESSVARLTEGLKGGPCGGLPWVWTWKILASLPLTTIYLGLFVDGLGF